MRLEDPRVRREQPPTVAPTQQVADLIAGNGCGRRDDQHERDGKAELRAQQSGGEQQAVARQEGEQQSRLDEDDGGEGEQHPRPCSGEERDRVEQACEEDVGHV